MFISTSSFLKRFSIIRAVYANPDIGLLYNQLCAGDRHVGSYIKQHQQTENG